ncbi:MAG: hypothetical protein ACFFAN_20760 [Promethearchaeota archaeon]
MAKKKVPEKKEPAPKKEPKKTAEKVEEIEPKKPKRITYKKVRCNLWRTRLHGEELGIYQSLKYQAKTRYFAKNN